MPTDETEDREGYHPCYFCEGKGYTWDDGEQGYGGRKLTCPACKGRGTEDDDE